MRGRYVRAIRWWVDFLADHRARWPQGEDVDATGAALVVEEGGDTDEPDMLPLSHSSTPTNLGPIMQRWESPSLVCGPQTICPPAYGRLPPGAVKAHIHLYYKTPPNGWHAQHRDTMCHKIY